MFRSLLTYLFLSKIFCLINKTIKLDKKNLIQHPILFEIMQYSNILNWKIINSYNNRIGFKVVHEQWIYKPYSIWNCVKNLCKYF